MAGWPPTFEICQKMTTRPIRVMTIPKSPLGSIFSEKIAFYRFLPFLVIFGKCGPQVPKGLKIGYFREPLPSVPKIKNREKWQNRNFLKFFRTLWTLASRLVWSTSKSAFWGLPNLKKRPVDPLGAQKPSYGPFGQDGGRAANFKNLPKNDHPTKLGDDHTKITVRVHSFQKNCVWSIFAIFGNFL